MKRRPFNRSLVPAIVAFCAVLAFAGVAFTLATHATFLSTAAEAEDGAKSVKAQTVSDTNASNGAAVHFGTIDASLPMPARIRGFQTAHLINVTPQMLQDIKNTWHANGIRLQIHLAEAAAYFGKPLPEAWPEILNLIDQRVSEANALGLAVVVDMHTPPYDSSVDYKTAAFWSRSDLEPTFIDAWTRIATKLKDKPGVWGLDLFNEPRNGDDSAPPPQWRPLAAKLLQTIRAIDPNVWIVYDPGPDGLASGWKNLTPLGDRVIYEFHDYMPWEFTSQCISNTLHCPSNYPYISGTTVVDKAKKLSYFQSVIDFQAKYHVPVYVGEFSVVRWAPKADAVHLLQDDISIYEQYGWSYTYHAFREYDGWSLELNETQGDLTPVVGFTDRGKVILDALSKNSTQSVSGL